MQICCDFVIAKNFEDFYHAPQDATQSLDTVLEAPTTTVKLFTGVFEILKGALFLFRVQFLYV